ncbi:hypothetical protein ACFOD9_06450 [Novosphingobium bradum]|uniref:Uncharacterized protein n=1 Tax=Novosphingobium bradum TaxID=1737444 RepID=A0ABV7IPJ9_9SPHN
MSGRKPLIAFTLLLGACSQSHSREVVETAPVSGTYPARLALDQGPLPVEAPPPQPQGGAWSAAGSSANDGVAFGIPGQPALFTLACTHDAAGVAHLAISRHTRAEAGAKALLALIGNGRIARLPVDAALPGEAGSWQGAIPATDARLDVLKGGNRIEATLPGGGTLLLPASGEPGHLLESCRASDRAPAA